MPRIYIEKTEESNPDPIEKESSGENLSKNDPLKIISSIGINEKYLFTSVLFKGEMEVFQSSLEKLSKATSLEESKQLLEEFSKINNWDVDNEVTINFSQLVYKRFEDI